MQSFSIPIKELKRALAGFKTSRLRDFRNNNFPVIQLVRQDGATTLTIEAVGDRLSYTVADADVPQTKLAKHLAAQRYQRENLAAAFNYHALNDALNLAEAVNNGAEKIRLTADTTGLTMIFGSTKSLLAKVPEDEKINNNFPPATVSDTPPVDLSAEEVAVLLHALKNYTSQDDSRYALKSAFWGHPTEYQERPWLMAADGRVLLLRKNFPAPPVPRVSEWSHLSFPSLPFLNSKFAGGAWRVSVSGFDSNFGTDTRAAGDTTPIKQPKTTLTVSVGGWTLQHSISDLYHKVPNFNDIFPKRKKDEKIEISLSAQDTVALAKLIRALPNQKGGQINTALTERDGFLHVQASLDGEPFNTNIPCDPFDRYAFSRDYLLSALTPPDDAPLRLELERKAEVRNDHNIHEPALITSGNTSILVMPCQFSIKQAVR